IILLSIPSSHICVCAYAAGVENRFCITSIHPQTLQPADISTVSITLKNIGAHSAYHVATEIIIDEKSPIKVLGRAKKDVALSIGADREITVQYDFCVDRNANATVYYIPIRVIWSEELEEEPEETEIHQETLFFGIRVSGQPKEAEVDIVNVTTVPPEIKPGTEASLKIEIENIGHSTINSLTVILLMEYPFTPLYSDPEEHIDVLKPGERTTVSFNIAVDIFARSSFYKIPVILKFEDDFGSHEKNTSVGVLVKGEPKVLIQEITLEPPKLSTGTDGLFMIRLINTGTESAEDTKIKIFGGENILTEEHQFIGEVAPGESQTATFGISVSEDAKIGKYGLKISISYKDKFGRNYSNSKIYEVSIFPAEPFIPMKYVYAFIAILILSTIIYFLILRFKKGIT
ncbi:MAG: COG1361 S-layer family protein, partial [Candidatus Methanospirareceae archaeon]